MFRILIDTCVWLDLAKDHREQTVVAALEHLVEVGQVELIVPKTVVDEFQRNKTKVVAEARRSLQSHIRLVREAINRFASDVHKGDLLRGLDEVDHKIVTTDEAVIESIVKIENLLLGGQVLSINDSIKLRVTERAIAGRAPYHRDKNSVGDAIILETFAGVISRRSRKEVRFAFVTHNSKDFSDPAGDRRKPHPDIAELFVAPKSTYWGSLVELLKEIDPHLLDEVDAEVNFTMEPHRLSEILEAENLLFRQVWYNRHWNLRMEIEDGSRHVVPEAQYSRDPYQRDQILDSVWERALEAARKAEEEVGVENLGPWTDFEWGMVNGKLSALRWVLGDEWDMLDT